MVNRKISKILPYLTAFVCFAAVSMIYFAPQFEGKAIRMGDIVQYEGSSRDIREHNEKFGEDPQWTGNMFSGMPAILISMKFDSQVVKKLYPAIEFMGRPASMIFLAMAAFFVMLLMFGVNPWAAIVPSMAYGLSTYFFIIIGAGHITKMVASAYAPLMIGGVWFTLRRNMWAGAALTALFASLQIAANHPQITYYFGFVILALWINEGVRAVRRRLIPRFAKATGLLAVAAVLALGSNFAPLWYINQYSKYSTRSGTELSAAGSDGAVSLAGNGSEVAKRGGLELDYATQWSYGITESFNLFIPYFKGGSSEGNFSDDGDVANSLTRYGARQLAGQLPSYWGEQPGTAGPTYLGAVALFLFVLGLLILRRCDIVWVAAVSLIALLLSWGHNFMWFTELFFRWFPGYDKFRTVAMILVIVQWSVPFLAALALNRIWNGEIETARLKKAAAVSFCITGGVALFFALFGSTVFDFRGGADSLMGLPDDVLAAMRSERASMLRSDSWRSFMFVLLTASSVYLYSTGFFRKGAMMTVLGILVLADMIPVNLRFLPQSRFVDRKEIGITATPADRYIMQDGELGFRVLNLSVNTFNDATTSYFHRSVGGYHGAKLQRYQDLIDRYLTDPRSPVYNMLNTKYIIDADRETGQLSVVQNPEANGAAWFVDSVIIVNSPDEEIGALAWIDNKTEAVVDGMFGNMLAGVSPVGDSSAVIKLVEYRPNYLKYEYSSAEEGVAVFSEIYFNRGWNAWIDGEPAPYFRADYVLRAMVLPAGEHAVEFRFRAENFRTVSGITLAFSILVLLGVASSAAVFAVRTIKNRKNRNC